MLSVFDSFTVFRSCRADTRTVFGRLKLRSLNVIRPPEIFTPPGPAARRTANVTGLAGGSASATVNDCEREPSVSVIADTDTIGASALVSAIPTLTSTGLSPTALKTTVSSSSSVSPSTGVTSETG